jgi:hypothetical protein
MTTLALKVPALAALTAAALACGSSSPTTEPRAESTKEDPVSDDRAATSGGGDPATPSDPHEAAYAALVPRRTASQKIVEDQSWRAGDWRFFQLKDESSGNPVFSARGAVDAKGHVIAPRVTGDGAWNAFLTADGIDAKAALPRVAWLYEAAPVSRTGDDAPISDPKAQALVTDPVIEKTATGVKFVGWFARPPDFDPWRTTIDAPASGKATVAEEMWHKLPR